MVMPTAVTLEGVPDRSARQYLDLIITLWRRQPGYCGTRRLSAGGMA
jgi:hypothetical protein